MRNQIFVSCNASELKISQMYRKSYPPHMFPMMHLELAYKSDTLSDEIEGFNLAKNRR